ncbi:TrbI/VirB10 family protein [Acidithiobacillus ferriphilus]|uniref:TrbI/VirB10 family protein n=1 Tax=Acidithiobacillus ferriphilus TaxID=1689834 RepID=UPI001C068839|nr:TrbI/VirB10 family protein [Acidithiobacillus ferriphilus]MBU2854056.1 TrbI/VirB10 family protein [Acidithiobacillus ferriphilus]
MADQINNDSLLGAAPSGEDTNISAGNISGNSSGSSGSVRSATLSALRGSMDPHTKITKSKQWVVYGGIGLIGVVAVVAYVGIVSSGPSGPHAGVAPKSSFSTASAPLLRIPTVHSTAPATSANARANARGSSVVSIGANGKIVPSVASAASSSAPVDAGLTAKMLKARDAQVLARYEALQAALTQKQQSKITEANLALNAQAGGPAFKQPKTVSKINAAPIAVGYSQPPAATPDGALARNPSGAANKVGIGGDVAYLSENGKSASTRSDYLQQHVITPVSPYELQAGSVIPATMITGINSDLPGEITAQVRQDVYSSIDGSEVIPAGSQLVGMYNSQISAGQDRVQVVWLRLLFPDGKSINLDGMSGASGAGYSGFKDITDNHFWTIFGHSLMYSLLGGIGTIASGGFGSSTYSNPTIGQTMAQGVGSQLAQTGQDYAQQGMNEQPTLKIRPGYKFNVMVNKDIVFPNAYK